MSESRRRVRTKCPKHCSFPSTRDELKRHYTLGDFWVEVEMEDLSSFDEDLSDCLYKLPTENLPLVSVRCHRLRRLRCLL